MVAEQKLGPITSSFKRHHASWALLAGLATLGAVISLLPPSHGLGLAALIVSGVIVLFVARGANRFSLALFLAFLLRAGIALIDTYVATVPGSGGDSVFFEQFAATWANDPVVDLTERFRTGSFLISWTAVAIYQFVGTSALMIKVILALLATLTVWNVYRLSLELWGPVAASRTSQGTRQAMRPLRVDHPMDAPSSGGLVHQARQGTCNLSGPRLRQFKGQ